MSGLGVWVGGHAVLRDRWFFFHCDGVALFRLLRGLAMALIVSQGISCERRTSALSSVMHCVHTSRKEPHFPGSAPCVE